MPKKSEVVDLYIRVDAEKSYYRRGTGIDRIKYLRSDLEDMVANIKRHVDNVQRVEIIPEIEETCEFCGRKWTEFSDTYNGGCCDEDEANNPDRTGAVDISDGNGLM